MDFVRQHLFFILCGLAAVGGVALGAMGLQGMPKVADEMKAAKQLYEQLGSLRSNPVNRDRIEAERRRINQIIEDRKKVFEKACELYGFDEADGRCVPKQLVDGAFPDGDSIKLLAFRNAYGQAMDELFGKLHAGRPATRIDIDVWRDQIANERAEREAYGENAALAAGPAFTPAGVLTAAGILEDAEARAHVAAARNIYCYATDFKDSSGPSRPASLQFAAALEDTSLAEAPPVGDVWFAQLGYWIQKDVVDAIVAVNEAAAEEAKKRNEDAWVGIMPIKDVISIRVTNDYVPLDGDFVPGAPPGGYDEAEPPGTPETVFTHHGSTDWYEVVQFTVKLVMDERDILRFVEELSGSSFHLLLRAVYERVPPNRTLHGKIYGSEPTVNVVFDFETILLGDVFRPIMPSEVCEDFGIACPQPQEDEGD